MNTVKPKDGEIRCSRKTTFARIGIYWCFIWLGMMGCTPASPWHYHSLSTYAREERSGCLRFVDPNRLGGLDVEILHSVRGTYTYITCLGGTRSDEKLLTLCIGGATYRYSVPCMEGGERFLLPQEVTQQLLLALQGTEPVTLQMEYHLTTLDPKTCTYYVRRLHQVGTKPTDSERIRS